MKSSDQKGYELIAGVLMAFAVSTLSVDFISRQYPDIDALTSVFWGWWGCVALTTPFYLGRENMRRRLVEETKKHWKLLMVTSVLTTLGGILWFVSIFQSTSGLVSVLAQAETIFAFLLGVLFLRERVNGKEILGLAIALIGFLIISNIEGEIQPITVFIVLLSSFLYASQSLLVKKYGFHIDALAYGYLRTLLMVALLTMFVLSTQTLSWIGWTPFWILALGQVFGFILGRVMYFQAHKYLPISTLNVLLLLDPPLIVLLGFFFFGDMITLQKIIGSGLILGGLLYFSREKRKLKKQSL